LETGCTIPSTELLLKKRDSRGVNAKKRVQHSIFNTDKMEKQQQQNKKKQDFSGKLRLT